MLRCNAVAAGIDSPEAGQMIVADRLRSLREKKKLSQGDIEERTGLLRCYVSRVENGHTVPAVETLEKFARALEVPLYELLYEGDEPPQRHPALDIKGTGADAWGASGKDCSLPEADHPVLVEDG